MTNADARNLRRGDKVLYNGDTWTVNYVRVLPSYIASIRIQRGNEIINGLSADMIDHTCEVNKRNF